MNKRDYIQANKDWLAAKSKEEGVKALPNGIYYNVSSTNSKQCKLCVHNSFTCNAWFLWEEAVSG